jgi:hypothetical protein
MGLYIATPVLRLLTQANDKKLIKYSMALAFIMALCLPFLEAVLLRFLPETVPFLTDFVTLLKLPVAVFAAHFMFGYFAYNYDFSKRTRNTVYVLALVSVLLMAGGAYAFFKQQFSKLFFFSMHGSALSPFAFLSGAGVFVFGKELFVKTKFKDAAVLFIQKLAAYSLGVYLLHIIVVEVMAHFSLFNMLNFCSIIMIPVTAGVVFAFSNLIIALLYKIKWINNYLL